MIEIAYSKEKNKIRLMPKEVQETILRMQEVLDTEYGADRNKYEDDGVM